ncbi:branched-chain amino acid aminotransferase [Cohnella nanjingensis]|uniref:Branched-chain-amino-acid aminotransferase n=1 Tax=Cohnella nanjingensis TaxID=1387779 RepID=A0A7X0RPB4_9BACL|nr:branched-chain amino acid aminotransferase [Cohnella nanjingensis]MBB6671192.1 branched-chain amino acid aminotransferase [Cohnella nanjingensis]
MAYTIAREPAASKKPKPPQQELGFGTHFTDHMFMMDYDAGIGWHDPRIVPYQPLVMDPAAKVFHYGQTVFEGMKAFRAKDGRIRLFRPDAHLSRMNRSNVRLSVPLLDEELVLEALRQLILADRDWVPGTEGTSLYIRPFIIATEPLLGVAPSRQYRLIVILSPVGAYYAEGIRPVRIHVEPDYVRAVAGGVGAAKTSGNYAAGLKAQEEASKLGYAQVMWLDGVHRKYIEEVGSMNVFFRLGETVVTPALSGSILAGVTRDSVIRLLRHWGIAVEERSLSIDELVEAHRAGTLLEAFGTGTAAVVSPIGELQWQGEPQVIGGGVTGALAKRLYDAVTGIQRGSESDPFGWMVDLI